MKILYVEDNEDNIYMLKLRLERKNYDVIIARDGKEGAQFAIEHSPNLIIMDVGLPIMDGYEATKAIKNNDKTNTIPIIILTAHATVEAKEQAFAVGADEYETKPLNMTRLLEKVEKLLQHA